MKHYELSSGACFNCDALMVPDPMHTHDCTCPYCHRTNRTEFVDALGISFRGGYNQFFDSCGGNKNVILCDACAWSLLKFMPRLGPLLDVCEDTP